MSQRNPGRRGFYGGGSDEQTDTSDDSDETTEPDTGGMTAPVAGQAPPDDSTDQQDTTDEPRDVGGPSTGGATIDPGPTSEPDTGDTTSPVGGQTPPDDTTTQETVEPSEPQEPQTQPPEQPAVDPVGPSAIAAQTEFTESEAEELQQDVAGQSEFVDPSDVTFEETEEGITAYPVQSRVEQNIREQRASQYESVDPSDVILTETDEGYQTSFTEEAQTEIRDEQIADELGVESDEITVSEPELSTSPVAGQAPPEGQVTVDYTDEYFARQTRENIASQVEGVSANQVELSGEPGDFTVESIAGQDVSDSWVIEDNENQSIEEAQTEIEGLTETDGPTTIDANVATGIGQTTDPTFDPSDHPSGFAEALIDTETAEQVSDAGSFVSGSTVEGLQDAGEFLATGQGADDAGVIGDVVGGGFEGRAAGFAETVTGPAQGTVLGEGAESAIEGVLGTAPAAIARTPGDVALFARRTDQVARTIAANPGATPDVGRTALGFGAAGVAGTATAIAENPVRETAAIATMLGASGLAARGTRQIVGRSRFASRTPDTGGTTRRAGDRLDEPGSFEGFRSGSELSDYLPSDERAQGSLLPRGRTRQREITEEDIADPLGDPEQPGPAIQEIAEQRSAVTSRDRYEGVTGPSARGALRRQRRAEQPEVTVDDSLMSGRTDFMLGSIFGSQVGTFSASALSTDERQRQLLAERSDVDTLANIRPIETTGTAQVTAQDTERILRLVPAQTTVPATDTPTTPGNGGGDGGGRGRTPRLPILPEPPEGSDDDPLDLFDMDTETDVETGFYIDPL